MLEPNVGCLDGRGYPLLAFEFAAWPRSVVVRADRFRRTPSRSEDTHRSCNRGIVAFMPALGPFMRANAVIVIRFAPIRHAIGSVTALFALIVPAIAAVRRRIVSIMGPIDHAVDRRGRVTDRTGPCANRIASVKCRSGLIM